MIERLGEMRKGRREKREQREDREKKKFEEKEGPRDPPHPTLFLEFSRSGPVIVAIVANTLM